MALLCIAPVLAASPTGAQAPAAWNIAMVRGPAPGSGATVAVVDTGVDAGHVAFGGRVVPGIDLVDGDNDAADGHGHGTHVAGIAAGEGIACGTEAAAVIGVAPQISILPVRVLDDDGSGSFEKVIEGIRWAADHDATVINLSLGDAGIPIPGLTTSWKAEFRAAIQYAWDEGSIPVLASGNRNNDPTNILGSGFGDVKAVVVTALTNGKSRAGYANSVDGYEWGIAAPGGDGSGTTGHDIISALPDNGCGLLAGTSMAAPHVSGALALLRAHGLSKQAAVDKVLATAVPMGSGTGHGLLDVVAALDGLSVTTTVAPTTAPPTTPSTTATTAATTTSTTGETTTTEGSTTTASEESTTTTAVKPLSPVPSVPDDDGDQAVASMPLDTDDDTIPGVAAVGATMAVTLVWFGWVAAMRRSLTG